MREDGIKNHFLVSKDSTAAMRNPFAAEFVRERLARHQHWASQAQSSSSLQQTAPPLTACGGSTWSMATSNDDENSGSHLQPAEMHTDSG